MTIKVGSAGGGGAKLAPDLGYPSTIAGTNLLYPTKTITVDATGGLTTVLNLAGKFEIPLLYIGGHTSESSTIKLTVDGVIIWNDTFTFGALALIGSQVDFRESRTCDTSFLFEFQTATDTATTITYNAIPIL
jgi:hypothetical protein